MKYLEEKKKELEAYLPPLTRETDFDAFWEETKALSAARPLDMELVETDYPASHLRLYDVTYSGFDGAAIHGWYMEPVWDAAPGKFPCLINYHGFNGDRGMPSDFFLWTMAGMAVLTVDCREQGGRTGSSSSYGSTGIVKNVTSKGIMDPHEYYYRAVYMDCLRALDLACCLPRVDVSRLVIHGISQGGGIGTAVAGLDSRPAAALLDVPSCANLERRVLGEHGAFSAVTDYLRKYPDHTDTALRTLSYFDTMNLADRITCPVYASVALKDDVCPAQCFYAAYNRISAPKSIEVYPFNTHDGARHVHWQKKLQFLNDLGILD